MNVTVHLNKIYRIIDEETMEFRSSPVRMLPREDDSHPRGERLTAQKRYTRVIDRPDEYLFYEMGTKFSDRTFVQVAVRRTEVPGEVLPLNIVMGGVVSALLDSNVLFIEREDATVLGGRKERVFIPLLREPGDSGAWKSYVRWAADVKNWTRQAMALNYDKQVRAATSRIAFSAQLGDSGFVLQSDYGGQVLRDVDRALVFCRFVPRCSTGIMSASWYFGIREAVYFLTVVRKSLVEEAPAKTPKNFRDIVKYHEPLTEIIREI